MKQKQAQDPEYCPHCEDSICVMAPKMTWSASKLKITLKDVYAYGEWGVDTKQGHLLHLHKERYFGVFNHYFISRAPPILVCSKCDEQLPDESLPILKAVREMYRRLDKTGN